jgi:hypothetical protein
MLAHDTVGMSQTPSVRSTAAAQCGASQVTLPPGQSGGACAPGGPAFGQDVPGKRGRHLFVVPGVDLVHGRPWPPRVQRWHPAVGAGCIDCPGRRQRRVRMLELEVDDPRLVRRVPVVADTRTRRSPWMRMRPRFGRCCAPVRAVGVPRPVVVALPMTMGMRMCGKRVRIPRMYGRGDRWRCIDGQGRRSLRRPLPGRDGRGLGAWKQGLRRGADGRQVVVSRLPERSRHPDRPVQDEEGEHEQRRHAQPARRLLLGGVGPAWAIMARTAGARDGLVAARHAGCRHGWNSSAMPVNTIRMRGSIGSGPRPACYGRHRGLDAALRCRVAGWRSRDPSGPRPSGGWFRA